MGGATNGPAGRDLRPGTSIGEYRVHEVIGRGGMGTVYRATHREIGSAVAIKVLPGDWTGTDAERAERFLREARAASRVRHINVVQVFSLGRLDDGGLYYVMELLDGVPLRRYLAERGPLEPATASCIVGALAAALDALHASSVVHRDLKPSNVFLVRPDLGLSAAQVKLLDFGVARLLDARPGSELLTQAHSLIGTPAYMSPEQCRGRPAGPRSDVYALGVLTFELLSGQRPYTARSVGDLAVQQQAGEARSLHEVAPQLAAELAPPIARAMHLDSAARFSRASDFARAFAEASGVDPGPTGPPAPRRAQRGAPETDEMPSVTLPPAGGTLSMVRAAPRRGPLVVLGVAAVLALAVVLAVLLASPPAEPPTAAPSLVADGWAPLAAPIDPPPARAPPADASTVAPAAAAARAALTDAPAARDARVVRVTVRKIRSKRPPRGRRSKRRPAAKKDRVVRDLPVRF